MADNLEGYHIKPAMGCPLNIKAIDVLSSDQLTLLTLALVLLAMFTPLVAESSQQSQQLVFTSSHRIQSNSPPSPPPLIEILRRTISDHVTHTYSDDGLLDDDLRRTGPAGPAGPARHRRSGRLIGSCLSRPCLHGGTCHSTRFDEASVGEETFKCECLQAYFGDNCEIGRTIGDI